MGLREVDEGWDFKILILGEEWVVRWPRHRLAVEEILAKGNHHGPLPPEFRSEAAWLLADKPR